MVREIISLPRCFSGGCDSEDGCSSVTDGSAVVFGVVDAGFVVPAVNLLLMVCLQSLNTYY
jgi:hypothetical protein